MRNLKESWLLSKVHCSTLIFTIWHEEFVVEKQSESISMKNVVNQDNIPASTLFAI